MSGIPKSKRTSIACLSIVAASLLLIASVAFAASSCSAANAEYDDLAGSISSSRIAANIQALQDFGSREFHLNNSDEIAAFIEQQFEEAGVEAELQQFTVGGVNVSNVVATLPGKDPELGAILFGAHYDSENRIATNLSLTENLTAPGADDDASGVAAVIEMAHALSGETFEQTLKFVAFAAEEYGYDESGGLAGSRYFATREKEDGVSYAAVAIMDMIGFTLMGENKVYVISDTSEDPLATAMIDAVSEYNIDLNLTFVVNSGIRYSDHLSFWNNDYPGLLVIEEIDEYNKFPINPQYHTSGDVIDKLSMPQIVEVSKAVLGGVLALLTPVNGTSLLIPAFSAALIVIVVAVLVLYIIRRKKTV